MRDTGDTATARLSERALMALKYPSQPQLLDAFVALAELYEIQADLVAGKHFAAVAQALIATETQSGGPYLTQDVTEDGIAANAAVAYFMELLGTPLPNLTRYLQQAARLQQSGQLTITNNTRHCLERALALHSSGVYPADLSKPNRQSLPAQTLTPDQQTMHGRIMAQCKKRIAAAPAELHASLNMALRDIKATDVQHEIALLPLFFMESFKAEKAELGKNSITPMPTNLELCQTLGVANVFCWIAYTAYDNILDNEPYASLQLSMANLAQRYAHSLYIEASPNRKTTHYITTVFDAMDAANNWELHNCRADILPGLKNGRVGIDVQNSDSIVIGTLPRYGDRIILAQRAFAHILGPLLVLTRAGHLPSSPQFARIGRGLQHFLVARQLQDDLHDWAQDMRSGQLSFVATDLLRQLRIQPGTYSVDTLESRMKDAFWRHGLTRNCDTVIRHTSTARAALEQSGVFSLGGSATGSKTTSNYMITLINRLEDAAVQAKQNYQQNQEFNKLYPLA